MFKENEIVYYIVHYHSSNERLNKPYINYGTVEYENEYGVRIKKYQLNNFSYVEGVPYYDFVPSDKWYKRPKGVEVKDYLDAHITHPMSAEDIHKLLQPSTLDRKDMIDKAIKNNLLIPITDLSIDIEISPDKKCYRLIWENERILRYTTPKTTICDKNEVFSEYQDAVNYLNALKASIEEEKSHRVEIDFFEDIDTILDRVPQCDNIDEVKFLLISLPHRYGFSFRYYNNEILYREDFDDKWKVVWKF